MGLAEGRRERAKVLRGAELPGISSLPLHPQAIKTSGPSKNLSLAQPETCEEGSVA